MNRRGKGREKRRGEEKDKKGGRKRREGAHIEIKRPEPKS